jgi:hypothetical protein
MGEEEKKQQEVPQKKNISEVLNQYKENKEFYFRLRG